MKNASLLCGLLTLSLFVSACSSSSKKTEERKPQNTEYSNTSIGSGALAECANMPAATAEWSECHSNLYDRQTAEVRILTNALGKKYGLEETLQRGDSNWKAYVASLCEYKREVGGSGSALEGANFLICKIEESSKRIDFLKREISQ